jgi:hypothetical protein
MAIRWIGRFFQRNEGLIVEPALYDFDPLVGSGADDPVDETMLARDAS